jgi:hypothetical protein
MDKLPTPSGASFSESSFWNLGRIVAGLNVVMTLGLAAMWYAKKKTNAVLAQISGKVITAMVVGAAVVLYFSAYYPKVAYIYGVWVLISAGVAGGMSMNQAGTANLPYQ